MKTIFTRSAPKQKKASATRPASARSPTKQAALSGSPAVITRENHSISRKNINKNALHVLYKLHDAGYEAYLVGGSVRDLLLANSPKDFDVATDARPEKIRQIFKNCRLIGRRFRLAHVFFGREIIEVATFRAAHPEEDHPDARRSETGLLVRDNVYGDLEEDAWRRDFTVNALYYNIADFSVIDYTQGMADLKKRIIRILGDPALRYREDPVRILRAIRFAAKLNFTIAKETEAPIFSMKHLLSTVPPARLFEDILKLFYCGHAKRALELLRHYELFEILFPQTNHILLKHPASAAYLTLLVQSCENTDERARQGLSLNPAYLFSVLLWPVLQVGTAQHIAQGNKPYVAFETAVNEVITAQLKTVAIPKRHTTTMREIWSLQRVLEKRIHRRLNWALAHPRFRAAYDFLQLRLQAGETHLKAIVGKLTVLQEDNSTAAEVFATEHTTQKRKSRRKRRVNNK